MRVFKYRFFQHVRSATAAYEHGAEVKMKISCLEEPKIQSLGQRVNNSLTCGGKLVLVFPTIPNIQADLAKALPGVTLLI
jgi:hypothetical protein